MRRSPQSPDTSLHSGRGLQSEGGRSGHSPHPPLPSLTQPHLAYRRIRRKPGFAGRGPFGQRGQILSRQWPHPLPYLETSPMWKGEGSGEPEVPSKLPSISSQFICLVPAVSTGLLQTRAGQCSGDWPPVATEPLTWGWCKLRCAVSIKYTLDFRFSRLNIKKECKIVQ